MLKLVAVLLTLFVAVNCVPQRWTLKLNAYGLRRVRNTPAYKCSTGRFTSYEPGYYKFSTKFDTHIVKPSLCVKKYYTKSFATPFAYWYALFKTTWVRKSDRIPVYFQCGKPTVSKY